MIPILLVDDESALLEVTKIFLERGGEFRVETAASAEEAIGKLKKERYEALVSDYQMPGMDGIEFLKYLRPRCKGMPFILFTGKGGEDVAIEALNAGADFYVQKGELPRARFAELETKIRSAVARRQSEQALRQSEKAYRSLVENLTGIVFTVNDEGILTYASPRISRFGYDPKDVTGKDFAILVCAEDIPLVAHHFARVKQGMTSRFEFRLTSKSRQSCRVCASCRPQMDQAMCTGVQGLLTEIPDDKKEGDTSGGHEVAEKNEAHQTHTRRAALFEETFRQAPLACLTLSKDGLITDINRAALVLLGCPEDTVTGRDLAGFIIGENQARFSAGLLELKHSGSIHAERFALARNGGCTTVVSLDGSVVQDPGGNTSLLFVTLTDITEQVREATMLQATSASAEGILAGAREGILVCTPALVLSRWNPAMEDITGIASRDACGKPLADMLPFLHGTGPDSPPVRAMAGEIVATPDSRYEYPVSGKCGWARAIFSPLRDARGEVEGIIGVVQEVTLRTTAARRIRAANRLYAISSRVSAAVAQARDLESLLAGTCRIAADEDAIGMAWIGLFDHAAGIIRPVAHAGDGECLPKEGFRIADADQGTGLVGDAIRSGIPVTCHDTTTDPKPWMEEAHRQGYRSLAAVPFRLKGQIVGVLTLCSGEPYAFSDDESEQLALLGTTLSSALDQLDKKTLQRRAGKGSHGSWERTRFLAGGIESSSVPFAAVFPDGSTGAVNSSLCAMLGYTEDELLALPLTSLFFGGTTADEKRFLRVMTTKIPERYESTIRTKDGTILPVECFLQAMTDETSGQPCTYAFITDVADRKRRMDRLEEERQQYLVFFETASAAIVVTTPEGSVLAANPAACRLFGRTEEALRSAEGGGLAGTGDPRFVELARTCKENGTAQGELRLIREEGIQFDAAVRAVWIKNRDGQGAMNLTLWDITGQKKAGAALKHDRNCVVSILDSLPNPVRRSNPDGECIFFNKAWLAFTGRVPADETGDGWMEGIHPDDRDRYREIARTQDNHQGPSEVEYRLRNNAGEYRWIREVRIPGPAPDGTETGITYSCFDIHECRLAEEALEEERGLYRAVSENTADAILLVSDRILDCNAAAMRLFAGTREDLIGHDIKDFFPRYQPDGRASADAAREYLEAARETPQTFPWVSLRTDGTTRETHVTLTTLSIHGEEQVLVVFVDLTGKKQAEHEIQRLVSYPEMNPNPVIEVRPDRTITYTNPATAAVLSSLGLPDDPAAFLPADFDAVVKTLNPAEPIMINRIVHLKERSFNESISFAPGPNSLRIYAYDITDRIQAMEALAYANHKLGILTSITRHDIQNKLTGVLGYLDLIRSSLRDPQLIGFLDKAETSANAIRHHIDFTKDYESLGGTAPVWQEITPILANVRSHFDVGEIAFEEPAPGFAVFADPMFGKVLYNLCDNSLRHGVHVRHIRIRCTPADTGCTLIYEDDGVGIPQDKKELIFERGFTTSSGSAKSSGLGLFLVRDILAITGISIKETGVPGAGSRFEMVIPRGKWRCGPAE